MYNVTVRLRDSNGMAKRMVRPREDWVVRENTHPALITKEKFDRIQQIIGERKEKDTKEWSCTKKYLLSGLLYCASCGGKLYGGKIPKNYAKKMMKQDRKDDDYYYYYFDKKANGKCTHKAANYQMTIVEEKVMDTIKSLFTSSELLDERIRNKQYVYDTRLEKEKKERELVTGKLDAVLAAIKKQQMAFEVDVITLDEYKSRLNELREQKLNYTRRLESLNNKLDKVDSIEERYFSIKGKVKGLLDNISNLNYDLKEEIVRKIVKRITINEDYSMTFEFTFED